MIALSNVMDIREILMSADPPARGEWDNDYGTALCRSDRFWEVFSGLYASLKKKHSQPQIDAWVSATFPNQTCLADDCFGNTGTCCGCDEWEPIQRRYISYDEISGNGGPLTGGQDVNDLLNQVYDPSTGLHDANQLNGILGSDITTQCTETCESYRADWARELRECELMGLLDTMEMRLLLDDLQAICESGCDVDHLLGASNSPDGSQSFQQAIETALANAGAGSMTSFCNNLLINAPPPYDTDIFGGSMPFIDDCVCDRYNHEYERYALGQTNPDFSGFYAYLENTYDVDYTSEVIVDIDCACRNIDSPFLLDRPTSSFEIPEPFACVACIDCDQAADLYNDFLSLNYFNPVTAETIASEEYQRAVTNWYNQELNFNLSFNEYLDFFGYCNFGLTPPTFHMQEQGAKLAAVSDYPVAYLGDRRVSKADPEYQEFIGRMANTNLVFELRANQTSTQPGGTVTYDLTITNNGTTTVNFDYFDQLPGGWEFDVYPFNLYGGSLNATTADIMSVSGVSLLAGETILWNLTVNVTTQAYVARNYYHQAEVREATDTTYSDDPSTNEAMDPTGIYLEIDDPCLRPVEEADDLVALLNELITIVGPTPTYPVTIPANTLTAFGTNSSLNLWPHLNLDNINLVIPNPAGSNGLEIMVENICGTGEVLCGLTLENITTLSDIQEVRHASTLGVTNAGGNFVLQLDILTSTGIETTILASSSCYSLLPCEKRRLCNRSITFDGEEKDDCLDYIFDLLALQATTQYETAINNAIERFRLGYALQCMDVTEDLDQSYQSREYHHTLYYYDQSGNLLRTIPPKGINVLHQSTDLDQVLAHRNDGTGNAVYPAHELRTDYQYNSYNAIVIQDSPDADHVDLFYDRLGRVVVSQDGRQREYTNPRYSYSIYDEQSRIVETGEIIQDQMTEAMTVAIAVIPGALNTWLSHMSSQRVQVVKTIYDKNLEDVGQSINIDDYFDTNNPRRYLRKRISSSLFFETYVPGILDYDHASHYDYDVHGNVKTLIQEFASLKNINQHLKRIDYDYDLVSGNMHQVSYQDGKADAFYHRYHYDADNRITNVSTSHDGMIWDNDASYKYYDHGPLARNRNRSRQSSGL